MDVLLLPVHGMQSVDHDTSVVFGDETILVEEVSQITDLTDLGEKRGENAYRGAYHVLDNSDGLLLGDGVDLLSELYGGGALVFTYTSLHYHPSFDPTLSRGNNSLQLV